jgi:hypothetical protein
LRRLVPDAELVYRRATGETLRALALDYGVAHTPLGRYFARPEVARQLRQAGPLVRRAERRALRARLGAEGRAEREVIEAVIEATGLHTRDNALRLIDPAILVRAFDNDGAASAAAPPDPSRLRRLVPDLALLRRRAAGESLRRLARDYGVAHTTLARWFARPEVAGQLGLLRLRSRAPSGRHIRWSQQTGQRESYKRCLEPVAADSRAGAGTYADQKCPGGATGKRRRCAGYAAVPGRQTRAAGDEWLLGWSVSSPIARFRRPIPF